MVEDKTPEKNRAMAATAFEWLSGQPFNNVLLVGILFALGWGLHYTATQLVPTSIKTIQGGYEQMEQRHRQERQEDRIQYGEWLDRYDRRGVDGRKAEHTSAALGAMKPEE